MHNLSELMDELDRYISLTEDAIRDKSPDREKKHRAKLISVVNDIRSNYPAEDINIEDINNNLEELRRI